ncbi:hypothetical protein LO762_11245 [Actinocorallia sp. API 0066]|uniref:hypothetical protein n=1 Tax=Actinocorallia sp. API 0066 TaxID=2896846 RepID=UPI001E622A9C|nr:hypothetical protein [Actinocorallia sp. API 0066]MCD0449759.1 hypothetical protein [Actinocorallia sp. API 0066]
MARMGVPRVTSGVAALAGVGVLYSVTTVAGAGLLPVLVAVLCVAVVVVVIVKACDRATRTVGLAVPLLVLALAGGLAATSLPERAMLLLLRGDLERIAGQDRPGRAGPYRIEAPLRQGSAVLLEVSGSGWIFAHGGYIHAPDGAGTVPAFGEYAESFRYRHLTGPWYTYYMIES